MTVPASGKFDWNVNPSLRPSQYTSQFLPESYTLTCAAPDGILLEFACWMRTFTSADVAHQPKTSADRTAAKERHAAPA